MGIDYSKEPLHFKGTGATILKHTTLMVMGPRDEEGRREVVTQLAAQQGLTFPLLLPCVFQEEPRMSALIPRHEAFPLKNVPCFCGAPNCYLVFWGFWP